MKILIQGDREKARIKRLRIKKFRCTVCDCVFEAGNDEYKESQHDGIYCKCPCCGECVQYYDPEW